LRWESLASLSTLARTGRGMDARSVGRFPTRPQCCGNTVRSELFRNARRACGTRTTSRKGPRASMKIAFYAPLKSPHHPVPSGDRLMARQLLACLGHAGHAVALASELRAFCGDSDDAAAYAALTAQAAAEVERLSTLWRAEGAPDLWFCYHPYYKAPDLIGPALCERFGIAYATAEASYSGRRNVGIWADMQARVLEAVRGATVNIGLTARDRAGLAAATPEAIIAPLKPFIDAAPFTGQTPRPQPGHLVTVAMMRAGDKLESFRALADGAAAYGRGQCPGAFRWWATGRCAGEVRSTVCRLRRRAHRLAGAEAAARLWQRYPGQKAHSMSGRAAARPMGSPIWRRRPPACPSSPLRTAGRAGGRRGRQATGRLTAPGDLAAYAARQSRPCMDDAPRNAGVWRTMPAPACSPSIRCRPPPRRSTPSCAKPSERQR
jgi:hypothetical protein